MKNSIFTIALLFGATIAFAQQQETTTNGRITTTNADANQGKLTEVSQNSSSNGSKKEYVGHVTLIKREAKPASSDTNLEATVTNGQVSEKKHTKTGHVTLLK